MLPDLDGGTYNSGESTESWDLRCDCGHEFRVDEKTFEGRHVTKTCGRNECQYTVAKSQGPPPGRPRLQGRGVSCQVYMPLYLYQPLVERAEKNFTSFSKTVVDVLRTGWEETQRIESKSKKTEIASEGELIPVPMAEAPDW